MPGKELQTKYHVNSRDEGYKLLSQFIDPSLLEGPKKWSARTEKYHVHGVVDLPFNKFLTALNESTTGKVCVAVMTNQPVFQLYTSRIYGEDSDIPDFVFTNAVTLAVRSSKSIYAPGYDHDYIAWHERTPDEPNGPDYIIKTLLSKEEVLAKLGQKDNITVTFDGLEEPSHANLPELHKKAS